MMGLAFVPAAFFNLFAMRQTALIGCLLGIGLPFIAARIMKRGRRGDARRAAVLMGVAAGLGTGLGAGAGPIIGLLFALGAWGGVQATCAGLAIAAGGGLRDAVSSLASSGALGDVLAHPGTGYAVVYHVELLMLFFTLIAIGPLVRSSRRAVAPSSLKFGLPVLPG